MFVLTSYVLRLGKEDNHANHRCLLHYVTLASHSLTLLLMLRGGGPYEETSRGRLSIRISVHSLITSPAFTAIQCNWLTVCIQEDVNILMGK